jgi:hypothetical protein
MYQRSSLISMAALFCAVLPYHVPSMGWQYCCEPKVKTRCFHVLPSLVNTASWKFADALSKSPFTYAPVSAPPVHAGATPGQLAPYVVPPVLDVLGLGTPAYSAVTSLLLSQRPQ